jgi:hypothetical protein
LERAVADNSGIGEYQYPPLTRIINVGIAVLMVVFSLSMTHTMFSWYLAVEGNPAMLAILAVPGLMMLGMATFFLNWAPDLVLTFGGIRVQLFTLWHVFVPWQDVLEIRKSWIPCAGVSIILVRGLTPVHRVFGLLYGLTTAAVIPVEHSLPAFPQLSEEVHQQLIRRGRVDG